VAPSRGGSGGLSLKIILDHPLADSIEQPPYSESRSAEPHLSSSVRGQPLGGRGSIRRTDSSGNGAVRKGGLFGIQIVIIQTGGFVSAKIRHLAYLPQAQPERPGRAQEMIAPVDGEGLGNCTNQGEYEAVCPKEIKLTSIAEMKRD
jgi:hypothetical protein